MSEIRKRCISPRTALRKDNLSGSFICSKYRFSPYMACEHGCAYCDGRAERYYVEGDFERDIVVRENLPELLKQELSKLRERGIISIGSGVSDAYQPVEREEQLTRRCAEVLVDTSLPVALMTKSDLIIRDIDLWSNINGGSLFLMMMSHTFADDQLRQIFEPKASTVEARLNTLKSFKDAGCAVGVLAMPLLPGISDTEENLRQLFNSLADFEPDFVMPSGLTLRPGKQKEHYLHVIKKHFPQLMTKYEDLYRENRPSGMVLGSYRYPVHRKMHEILKDYRLPHLVPHRIYRNHVMLYDEINILMMHMMELYELRGIDTGPLRSSAGRFQEWLVEHKKEYNRRRSMKYEELADLVRDGLQDGRIAKIIDNPKLLTFLQAVALEGREFDYVDLTLN